MTDKVNLVFVAFSCRNSWGGMSWGTQAWMGDELPENNRWWKQNSPPSVMTLMNRSLCIHSIMIDSLGKTFVSFQLLCLSHDIIHSKSSYLRYKQSFVYQSVTNRQQNWYLMGTPPIPSFTTHKVSSRNSSQGGKTHLPTECPTEDQQEWPAQSSSPVCWPNLAPCNISEKMQPMEADHLELSHCC